MEYSMNNYIIRRSNIASTNCYVYSVWERCSEPYRGYYTFMTIRGECYGSVSTREIPEGVSDYKDYYENIRKFCIRLIRDHFPELKTVPHVVIHSSGEIEAFPEETWERSVEIEVVA